MRFEHEVSDEFDDILFNEGVNIKKRLDINFKNETLTLMFFLKAKK
jgi:hypothetical protein